MSEFIETLEDIERAHIRRALRLCGGNVTKTAYLLGISRATLYRKLKIYEIKYES